MVAQIHPGVHRHERQRPVKRVNQNLLGGLPNAGAFEGQEREVHGVEEHVLGVAGGPAMGVAHLEKRAGLGAGLLDGGLDELVDELGDQEA